MESYDQNSIDHIKKKTGQVTISGNKTKLCDQGWDFENRRDQIFQWIFIISLKFPWKLKFVLNTKENDDILLVLSNSSLLIKSESSSWSDDQGCMHGASVDVLLLPPNSNSIWLLEKHYTNIFNWQWDMSSSENKSQDALHMPYIDVVRTDTIVAKGLPGKTHSRKAECLWKAFCSFSN